jgi:hypothetical protein
VYILKEKIKESDLQNLRFFTEYGKYVKTVYNLKEKIKESTSRISASSLSMASKSKLCTS